MTNRPLTIAYLTSSYARATDTFIRDEVEELRRLGERVVTFSIRRPSEAELVNEDVVRERRQTTYLLDVGRGQYLRALVAHLLLRPRSLGRAVSAAGQLSRPGVKGRLWPLFYLLEACLLASMLRREKVDHLHNHIAEGSASVAMLASILSGVPFSLTVHGPSEWDRPWELALELKSRRAAFVAVISEYTAGQLRRWVSHEDWSKVHVVRCGLRLERYAPAEPRLRDRTTLVSVGRLAPEKGHRVLLESLSALGAAASRLRVVLVGDGPERPRLEAYARRSGLEDVVEFVGWKSSEEVRDLVQAADVLVMPSFAEGLPVSIMEAFACGVPVLSSDVGGISELVQPGVSGWLVPAGSVAQLTAALTQVSAASPEQLRALGAAGRRSVQARHDLVSEVARLDRLVRGLQHH